MIGAEVERALVHGRSPFECILNESYRPCCLRGRGDLKGEKTCLRRACLWSSVVGTEGSEDRHTELIMEVHLWGAKTSPRIFSFSVSSTAHHRCTTNACVATRAPWERRLARRPGDHQRCHRWAAAAMGIVGLSADTIHQLDQYYL